MEKLNIYQKLKQVRKEIGTLTKSEDNDFLKYKYVSEYTYLKTISPLLSDNNLVLTFEDTDFQPIVSERGKEFQLLYQKQAILTDCENEKSLVFKFWATGQNTDIAKAKGSAETYAVKYFLQKFFMVPTTDDNDPDKLASGRLNISITEDNYQDPEIRETLTEKQKETVDRAFGKKPEKKSVLLDKTEKCTNCQQLLAKESLKAFGSAGKFCSKCYEWKKKQVYGKK